MGQKVKRQVSENMNFSPDSEAMAFLLQITMSCLRALSRQVSSAGAAAVSRLRTWWRQVAGPGRRAPAPVLGAGCARGGDRAALVLVL